MMPKIVVNPAIPDGVIEFRDASGKILGAIVDIETPPSKEAPRG